MERQSRIQHQIRSALDNFKKLGRSKWTPAVVRSRIRTLKETWTTFVDGLTALERANPEESRAKLPCFADNYFDEMEDVYHSALDYMAEVLEELEPPVSPNQSLNMSAARPASSEFSLSHLPPIKLPPFDGNLTNWEQFRDRFSALIIENKELNNFARMHFLASCLQGQAAESIASLPITADNFNVAWNALKARYENKRRLLSVHMSALLNLPSVTRESAVELQALRGKVSVTVAALRNLQRSDSQLWNDILVHVVSQGLDPATRKAWNLRAAESSEPPMFNALEHFISSRIRALEECAVGVGNRLTGKPVQVSRVHVATQSALVRTSCPLCKAHHYFSSCPVFVRGSPRQRRELVKQHRRCFNCLSQKHTAQECNSRYSCRTCSKRHHSLLHIASDSGELATESSGRADVPSSSSESRAEIHAMLAAAAGARRTRVFLATARVAVESGGRSVIVRALLDQGSEMTFVSESLAQLLRARRIRMPVSVSALGGVDAGTFRHAIKISISPRATSEPLLFATALVLGSLTTYVSPRAADASCLTHLADLPWADPNPLGSEPIDLIIGADIYGDVLRGGLRRGAAGQPVAQESIFGWIISGPAESPSGARSAVRASSGDELCESIAALHCSARVSLDEAIKQFWEIEEVPCAPHRSPADDLCEDHFMATHSRTATGRYVVRLPFREGPPIDIGSSRARAIKCLDALTRRLQSKPDQRQSYHEFMRDYEELKHMKRIASAPISSDQVVFIPHHPVIRAHSVTTKLRVVFNASSATTNGTCLNDHMFTGPKLQTDLSSVLMQWRHYRYVCSADIEKMYRQIMIDPRDLDYQRILWKDALDEVPTEFQLLTVTYGMACAPFLALRVLRQLVRDDGADFPRAVPIMRNNVYVDDVLFGSDKIETTQSMRDQLIALLRRGGFELRKWSSNTPTLLAGLDEASPDLAGNKTLANDQRVKILGIKWIPSQDAFQIGVSLPDAIPSSRRSILSVIAKLYDPLGWVTPVIISLKILMQDLWRQPLEWDDPIPKELCSLWRRTFSNLSFLDGLRIPRWTGFGADVRKTELHGFADASNKAYAAVVYSRVVTNSGQIIVTLLAGKSRVAPLKILSVPRLELSAAVLLSRLVRFIRTSGGLPDGPCYCWSDSSVVLTWLSDHPSRWKVFVANRVAEVQERLPDVLWRHVPTDENPADCASRGLLGRDLVHHALWWTGPAWLQRPADEWPDRLSESSLEAISERRVAMHHAYSPVLPWTELLLRYSSWPKLLRVTAYILRFVKHCRVPGARQLSAGECGRAVTATECRKARVYLLKQVQAELFPDDLQRLSRRAELTAKSPLLALRSFLDENGLIRVGGRISRAPLPFERRCQILLASHHITQLIVNHAHLRALHAGVQLTLNTVRRDFWIIRGRGIVRNQIHRCVVCTRERAAVPSQLMADLPRARVSAPKRSFLHCGVDYAGPVFVRASSGRGIAARKAYIALFVCLASRAVHLELVCDCSTQAFLNAFSRFSARRGLPEQMYSDNGTAFVGADRELAAAYRAALRDPALQNSTAVDGITWSFIPPNAPHFGGIWEAGIKSVKHHVRRVLRNHTLTIDEYATLLCRIEACLNSRPISQLSDTLDDLEPLTPGHFLIGSMIALPPEPSTLDVNENRLTRWQLVRHLNERFWRIWYDDYVNTLQQRSKWRKVQPSIKIGQLVLLRNSTLPPCKWELGRVTQCYPGSDGLTRAVSVRTATSEMRRPIVKLCVLPVDCRN